MKGRPCLASLHDLAILGEGVPAEKNVGYGFLKLGCQVSILILNLLQEGFCNFPLIISLLYRNLQWMGLI